jgi:hypothetical protein
VFVYVIIGNEGDEVNMSAFKLRNGSGKRYTKQLFREQWANMAVDIRVEEAPPFSLYNNYPNTINFGKLYVQLGDPSGYKITQQLLGGDFKHWLDLMKCGWFVEAKKLWDMELDAKLASEGLDKIREVAGSEDKGALQAARYLADNFAGKKVRGRPTKEEVDGAMKQELSDRQTVDDDFLRIQVVK